jgi:hypothetical protein
VQSGRVELGSEDLDTSVLYEQIHVDLDELGRGVRAELLDRHQVGLADLVDRHGLDQGLAELVGYFSLSDPDYDVVVDEIRRDEVTWSFPEGDRVADTPAVTFVRSAEARS